MNVKIALHRVSCDARTPPPARAIGGILTAP
jgi:hypothetical protein